MEEIDWRSHYRKEEPRKADVLPVKVDIIEGADGLELHEIIFALQYTASSLRSSDLFRARYMERLVVKYQEIQQKRFQQIKQYFHERMVKGHYKNRNGNTSQHDETR